MLRLLLLETGSAFAERLARALSSCDHTVCRHETLAQFERSAAPCPSGYDAVVVDLRQELRDLDGTCRRVAARVQDRPIVAVTSLDDVDLAVRLVEAGADEVCLRSECNTDQLVRRMRAAAARHQTQAVWQQVAATAGHAAGHSPALQFTLQRDRAAADLDLLSEDGPSVRALCIDPAGELAPQRTWIRTAGFDLPLNIECVPGMREAVRALSETEFDVVVLCLPELCETALGAITVVRSCAPDAQLLISAAQVDDDFLVEAIHHGADDMLCASHNLSGAMIRSIRMAFARKWRRRETPEAAGDTTTAWRGADAHTGLCNAQPCPPHAPITRSAVAIPINPDFTPNLRVRAEGVSVDLAATGMRFELGLRTELPSESWLVGVEGDDAVLRFVTVRVRHWSSRGDRVQVGAQFVTPDQELLRDENLIPTLRSDTHRYATSLPTETLRGWVEAGVLRPLLLDRIYVCPKCGALPTFRRGCRSCGSIRIVNHSIILHAPCAFVATEAEFQQGGELVCPKCGPRAAASPAEFVRHLGPCQCLDCDWTDADVEIVGQCLCCHWHFPLEHAEERELIGYQARRLNPSALRDGCGGQPTGQDALDRAPAPIVAATADTRPAPHPSAVDSCRG